MSSRTVLWLFASALCGAWLAVAAGMGGTASPRIAPVEPRRGSPVDPLLDTIQQQGERMRGYLSSVQPLRPSSRNPFRFASHAAAPAAHPDQQGAVPAAPVPAMPAAPVLILSGIAEDAGPNGPVRTAIVSGLGDLFLVKEGNVFGGRFRIVKIGSDAVQVEDQQAGTTLTLALK